MIKCTDSNNSVESAFEMEKPRLVKASLVADTKEEVIAIGTDATTIQNLRETDTLDFGSTCLCTDGSFGILDSNGEWKF